ncbi:DUF5710 domain-containing protein [Marinobacterium sp. BA1]|uniref:DUF5710 domain-containing protein n=1 Tax=Marinobacterium sp. BA1 TaxID=3138931 RepID=UPI0032E69D9D
MASGKTYLNVPYSQKALAKELGCRWCPEEKKWFYTSDCTMHEIASWIPQKKPIVHVQKQDLTEEEIVAAFISLESSVQLPTVRHIYEDEIHNRFKDAFEIIKHLGPKPIFTKRAFCPQCDSDISNTWTIDGRIEYYHLYDHTQPFRINSAEKRMLESYLDERRKYILKQK